jgi:hypothetical protein
MIINWQGIYQSVSSGVFNGVASYAVISADNPLSVIKARMGTLAINAKDGLTTIKAIGGKVIYG